MPGIVHLDLKGAPLKVPYLEKVLICIKQWGASGVLLEWEDTFPYCGQLADIGSQANSGGDDMYTIDEVRHILRFAKEVGLEPIQLIQTIGHMEFVLKHPSFRHLRESPRSPAALCPSRAESQGLVRAMLRQALHAQPDAAYIHIGADEVWHTGVCPDCQRRAVASEHKTSSLYLDHIRSLALDLKISRPKLTILMWDDMLRSCSVDTLRAYQLGELVQPVVWMYSPGDCFQVAPQLWSTYKQVFPAVWAGSAFKGANGSCQVLSPVSRYVSNHEAWVREIRKHSDILFAGVILTGWSRYDHYATLCELLPASLPSLASCLRVLAAFDDQTVEPVVSEVLPSEQWPGEHLARCIHSFVMLRERSQGLIHGDLVATWLNPWQMSNRYTNPVQIEGIVVTAQQLFSELTSLQMEISAHLNTVTGKRSCQEWLDTFINPVWKQIRDIRDSAEARWRGDAGVRPEVG